MLYQLSYSRQAFIRAKFLLQIVLYVPMLYTMLYTRAAKPS